MVKTLTWSDEAPRPVTRPWGWHPRWGQATQTGSSGGLWSGSGSSPTWGAGGNWKTKVFLLLKGLDFTHLEELNVFTSFIVISNIIASSCKLEYESWKLNKFFNFKLKRAKPLCPIPTIVSISISLSWITFEMHHYKRCRDLAAEDS